MIVFEATVYAGVEVSAAIVKVGVTGGITVKVEVDIFDPWPETSGGLVYPFEVSHFVNVDQVISTFVLISNPYSTPSACCSFWRWDQAQ